MANRSNIESKIVTVIGSLADVQAYIAETDTLPYCTFTVEDDAPVYSKGELAAWNTEFTVYLVYRKKSDADSKADAIAEAFDGARSDSFLPTLQRRSAYYDEELDVWGVQLEYKSITV